MKESYALFSNWLIQHTCAPQTAISYLFDIDRLVRRRKYAEDFFSLIRNKSFKIIYALRHDYWYQKGFKDKEYVNQVIKWSFEYLCQSFDEYEEYEASRYFCDNYTKNTLLIYSGTISCFKHKHPVIDVAARLPINNGNYITIHASYCTKCKVAFIHKAYFKQLRQKYRFIVADFVELSADGYTAIKQSSMAAESKLMLCGYNVKADGLTDRERKQLLQEIMLYGILSKTQIINYLEHFLSFNGSQERMHYAVLNWEADLRFVRDFNLDHHPAISINRIEKYKRPLEILFSSDINTHYKATEPITPSISVDSTSKNELFATNRVDNQYKYINKRVFHKGIGIDNSPLKYGYITSETYTNITVAFDSGEQVQFSKSIFITGELVCIY